MKAISAMRLGLLSRVYDIALEAISHGDGRLGPGRLGHFVAAYQSIDVLTLGELWAIPIMLRLALIENLRRVSTQIAADRLDRNRAGYWADQMIEIADRDPKNLILLTADMARSKPPMTSAFVSEMARRLQGQSPALALPLTWIEQWLAEAGLTIEQSVHAGNQRQAADQVSISNSIGSLRALGAIDWSDFVESLSVVEHTLRQDPAGAYAQMDFASRDRYRHVVEKLAKQGVLTEPEVARAALEQANASAESEPGARSAHIGYYLVDSGLQELETIAQRRFTFAQAMRRIGRRRPSLAYLGSISLLTACISGVILSLAPLQDLSGMAIAALAILVMLASSQAVVELINWFATLFTRPQAMCSCTRNIRPAIRPTCSAGIAGFEVTGRSCVGCLGPCLGLPNPTGINIRSRFCRAGSCSTICGVAWSPVRSCCCCCLAG